MRLLLVAAVLAVPVAARATPVYLECTITDGNHPVVWNVTLDEAQSTVDYVIPELNVAQKTRAIFSPDKVMFNGLTISRLDLSMSRPPVLAGYPTDKGQCKLIEPPARKF